ncbi:MAG TPA: hypothetical protein DHV15_06610 [Treponema sp.]|uniref:Uncharacterized protein n=1 Tax=Treponema denticola (strain ATCC 35405 / DSM 14222 / CIP 103919 / JCM 8153 / KCTC 15104) TaxID=243275 RepID=Q73PN5_TREDE|nr:hypothetical protein TDE_0763 [Treponema denticola ATCC 35405]HCY95174.1 hypothetical protein [Treponema sp.]
MSIGKFVLFIKKKSGEPKKCAALITHINVYGYST